MRIEIPIKDLIKRLITNKFVVMDPHGLPKATARKDLVNFSHTEIVMFYTHRIRGLVNFYKFAVNYNSLRKIIMFLHLSCALTLALKLKLRTSKAVFNKFGRTLKDPETDYELILPTELKAIHKYNDKEQTSPEQILKMS